jgi:uncharacterized protein YggE
MSCRFPIALTAVLASLALPVTGLAETIREIVVTGEGRIEVTPDLATIRVGVESQGESAAEALAGNAEAARAVIAALEAEGVESRDMQTSQLGLEPIYRHDENGRRSPEVVGYVARNLLTVRLREIEGIGRVIDAMSAAGANRIDGIAFGLADMRPPLDEARERAVRDARAKAELYAAAAEVELGPVLAIRETQPFDRPFPMAARMEAMMDGAIAEGSIEVMAMVEIVYGIAGGPDAD